MEHNKSAREMLEILRVLSETAHIEAKLCRAVSDSVMETVCAYANEPGAGGGQLLLGVDEQRELLIPTYPVVGIKELDKIQNDLISQCRSRFNTAVAPRITVERVEGKNVLNVFIPESPVSVKPIFFKELHLPAGAFRRGASGDVRCTEDDLIALFEGRNSQSYDSSVAPGAKWRDIDLDVVAEYRRDRKKVAPDVGEHDMSDEELLYSLGCVEEVGELYVPTVAGILLFGKAAAIRRLFPLMRMDYIPIPGLEWVADPAAQFDSVDMLGPLMQVVKDSLKTVLNDVSSGSILPEGEAQRRAVSTMPSRGLREAIVNAVMHRSYRVQGATQIIRYANRIEIRNPGYSLKSEESWGGTRSINRNPKVAAVMYDGRYAETKGRGMKVMQKAMEDAGLTPPFFESSRTDDSFTVTFLLHHFLSEGDLQWLAGFKEHQLTNEEAKALIWVRETGGTEGAIDVAVYRNLNQGDALSAAQHLSRLQELSILKKRGRGSMAYYKPGKVFVEVHSQWLSERALHSLPLAESSPLTNTEVSPHLESQRGELTPPVRLKEGSLEQWLAPQGEGEQSVHSLRNSLVEELPDDLRDQVEAVGGRAVLSDMTQALSALCAFRPYRAVELGLLLNRDAKKLTEAYLSPMRKRGELHWLYPEIPSHPQQAYLHSND